MTRIWQYFGVAAISLALLASCASNPGAGPQEDLRTSSDQTEAQRLARIRLQLAVGYYQQRQLPTALDEVKQALQADPNFADAYSVRGLIYMDMGEYALAEDNFRQALKLAPSNPDFNNNYGWLLCQSGRERESIPYFETALKSRAYQSPEKAMTNAGVCSLKAGDSAAAENYLAQAFKHDPGNPTTNAALGKVYFDKADFQRARFYLGTAMKANLMTPEVLWLAIRTEHKLGDRAAERSLANQLRRRHPASKEYAAYQRGAFDE